MSYSGTSGVPGTINLTGNSGGLVGPTAGNINILGSGIVSVVGTPGSSTLTINSSGGGTPVAFLLQNTPLLSNITGDGTVYQYGAGQSLTTIFDLGSDCTTGDGIGTPATFTAPITGIYWLQIVIHLTNTAPESIGIVEMVTTGKTYTYQLNPTQTASNDLQSNTYDCTFSFSQIAEMSATDTAFFQLLVGDNLTGSLHVGLGVNAYISGFLVTT